MCNLIITNIDGQIEVESTEGQGSEFTFKVRLHQQVMDGVPNECYNVTQTINQEKLFIPNTVSMIHDPITYTINAIPTLRVSELSQISELQMESSRTEFMNFHSPRREIGQEI